MVPAFLTGKESTMLKVRTLFSGIGSPESALKKLGVDFEIVDFCEIDKYAVKSYCAIHGVDESKNLGDISKVWGRDLPYADLLVWGFPCQDISVAGKQRGITEGETRSGLYYEGFRILKETRPKYSIIENVKNLVGKSFRADFESMLDDIESIGYNNYWKVLNAKNYGIPQNRERVFIVSIRKDVDTGDFAFPEGFDNGLRLKDFLEDEVDEKFYISQDKVNKIINSAFMQEKTRIQNGNGICQTLLARDYKDPKCVPIDKSYNNPKVIQIGNIVDTGNWNNPQRGRIYSAEGCSPSLNTVGGGGLEPKILRPERTEYGKAIRKQYEAGEVEESRHNMTELHPREDGISNTLTTVQKDNMLLEPKIVCEQRTDEGLRFFKDGCVGTLRTIDACGDKRVLVKEATKQGYAIAEEGDSINIAFPNSETRRGRVDKECAQTLETSCNQAVIIGGEQKHQAIKTDGICTTLSASMGMGGGYVPMHNYDYRIRKLTPKECWRLMGFTDEEFQRAVDAGVSNSQLYKQAGNSIVVDVLEYIFRNLLK